MTTARRSRDRQVSGSLTAALHILALGFLLLYQPGLGDTVSMRETRMLPLEVRWLRAPQAVEVTLQDEKVESPRSPSQSRNPSPPRELTQRIDAFPASLPVTSSPPAGVGDLSIDGASATGDGDGDDSGNGRGAGAGPGNTTVAAPFWIEQPTPTQMRLHTPYEAVRDGVSGTVVLMCQVNHEHRARRCRIEREAPAAYGFGHAALRLSRLFRIQPFMRNGEPQYDAWIRIPVLFEHAD